jgi:oligopeptide transport system substrate-binding protein
MMTMTRRTLGLGASALALTTVAACGGAGGGAARPARILHMGNAAEPLSLDPHKASGTWENRIIGDMFVGLTTEDASANPIPGMAESWTTSPDGLTWTFKLRDATWSDGVPVTADDFVFAFRRILDPKTAAQYATMLNGFKNAEAVISGNMPPDAVGARAIDPKTLELTLDHPMPYLPGLLTHYTSFPVPKHVVEKFGETWIQPENIQVNGPFKLKEWRANTLVHVVKNESYWDQANVALNELFYYPTTDNNAAERQIRTKELDAQADFSGQRMEFLKKELPDYVRVHPYLGLNYIIFNQKKKPFDDVRVRTALTMAVDRVFAAEQILKAGQYPAYNLVPKGIANYPGGVEAAWKDQSVADRRIEAKKLLEAAGFGPNNPLSFTFTHRNTGDNPRLAPVFQNDWKQIAEWVQVEIMQIDTQIHYDNLRAGNFEVGDAGWIADFNDARNFLYLYETKSGAMNYGKFSNPEFDRLMKAADDEIDLAKRGELLVAAERIIVEQWPMCPTVFLVNKNLVSPRITGWVDNITDIHRARYLSTKEAAAEA